MLRSLVPQWKDVPSDWTPLAARLKVCTAREDFRQAVYTRWEELPDKWKKADWASPFCFVLEHELKEIFAKRGHRAAEGTNSDNRGGEKTKRAPVGQALDANLVGLAFSGGGIRSATFNLGVLQGLARYKLLRRVDYLSTVSGGGYIGAFLLSWLGQGPVDDETGVAHQKKPPEHTRETSRHMDDLERALSTEETPCPDSAAKRPIFFLRRFSNYLAPESSFFSVDTWTMFSIWGRNVLLNFMILASLFACVLLIPRLAYWIPRGTAGKILVWAGQFGAAGLLGGAAFLIGCNLWKIRSVQKLCREEKPERSKTPWPVLAQPHWVYAIAIPLLLSASIYSVWLLNTKVGWSWMWRYVFLVFLLVYSALLYATRGAKRLWRLRRLEAPLVICLAVLVPAIVSTVMLKSVANGIHVMDAFASGPAFVQVLGPAAVLACFTLGMIAHIGIMGRGLEDAEREWYGRLGAVVLLATLLMIAIPAASIFGPLLIRWVEIVLGDWAGSGVLLSWVLTTVAGGIAARGPSTGPALPGSPSSRRSKLRNLVATIAPYVFIVGFVLVVANCVHLITTPHILTKEGSSAGKIRIETSGGPVGIELPQQANSSTGLSMWSSAEQAYWKELSAARPFAPGSWYAPSGMLPLFALCFIIMALFCWRVDINEFSMHHLYKNRLVRCYLGARRSDDRNPQPFTGFDPDDDMTLASFCGEKYCGPYPLINGALNITAGEELAWQQRRAISFTFTPFACGYDVGRGIEHLREYREDPKVSPFAYRCTEGYAYPNGGGIPLGTAIAISGAAASPNMGYHTSTAVAFLLTVLNVRLGWWLGNPRRWKKYRNSGPQIGLMYLLNELFGKASARSAYVNITDGGHFENLGVYELIRRRCRFIIASDAEQDQALVCSGLANLVRRCRNDFGVEIDIGTQGLLRLEGLSRKHCVIGRIKYPERKEREQPGRGERSGVQRNSSDLDPEEGILLFLKATRSGDEPCDVQTYALEQAEFPHHSTGDQFFDEPQFESYRRLGEHIVDIAFCAVDTGLKQTPRQIFEEVRVQWAPENLAVRQCFTKYTEAFTALMKRLADSTTLDDVECSVFKSWKKKDGGGLPRQEFHFYNALIQFMENVYLDLDLDNKEQKKNPDVQGCLNLFKSWVTTDPMKKTWEIAKMTYGARFMSFYDRLHNEAQSADQPKAG